MRSIRPYFWLATLLVSLTFGCEKKSQTDEKPAVDAAAEETAQADAASGADEEQTLAIALPAGASLEGSKALGDALTKSTGIPTTARAFPTFADTLEALRDGDVQIAVLDAWPYYTGHHKADLTVLAAAEVDGKTQFDAGWYVKADSKISRLKDLEKKRIAFGARDTASGFLFATESLLASELIGPDDDPTQVFGEVKFARNEEEALKMLLAGRTDAVAVSAPTVAALEKPESVKLIQTSGPVPTRALAMKSMTDEDIKKKVREAFTSLDEKTSSEVTGAAKWVPREHYEYTVELQRASEKTLAEYPLKEEVD